VNISTELKHVFISSFVNYYNTHNVEYNPLKEIVFQYEGLKKAVKAKIRLFGGAGQAG